MLTWCSSSSIRYDSVSDALILPVLGAGDLCCSTDRRLKEPNEEAELINESSNSPGDVKSILNSEQILVYIILTSKINIKSVRCNSILLFSWVLLWIARLTRASLNGVVRCWTAVRTPFYLTSRSMFVSKSLKNKKSKKVKK
jgi:hypothetical protein